MAGFKMRNFDHFPVEKSSYDLKLELLEELDSEQALDLMKANHGFRSIYLRDPWRIFGREVFSIGFISDKILICKFRQATPFPCDLGFYLPLLKKITSCVRFHYPGYRRSQQVIDTARKILANLDFIENWWNPIHDLENFNECFSNFKGQITDYIDMNLVWYSGERNDPTHFVISRVFETQLGMCKEVRVACSFAQFSMIYKLFSKTNIRIISCAFHQTKPFSASDYEMVIRWIVCNGVPSQNREAWILISLYKDIPDSAYDSLGNFLSAFPGMQRLPDERWDSYHRYRRKIDDERDCLYKLTSSTFEVWHAPAQAK